LKTSTAMPLKNSCSHLQAYIPVYWKAVPTVILREKRVN
jgi:hypothetical protein